VNVETKDLVSAPLEVPSLDAEPAPFLKDRPVVGNFADFD
jgi:hypothetical protein